MSDFVYGPPFQRGDDTTEYTLLTDEYTSVVECAGRRIVKIDPVALELLAKRAFHEISFFQRSAHLEKVAAIFDDSSASDNDKYVASTMLRNSVVAANQVFPWCQDTGTAIVIAKKGEDVYTGTNDAYSLSKGIYATYQEDNLRYSQVIAQSMFEEKNSGTNLPAQIDISAVEGNKYEFLFIAKGGGSANKTFLYQQTKALLNETSLEQFVKEKIIDISTSACPPYHLVLVVGGLSAEATLKTVKEASAGNLDNLPTSGDATGRAFRDLLWEERVLRICRESGIGAQYGGSCFVHDVRVIRLPRHAASCPVGIGVSCSADRNIKAVIDERGVFLEKLEHNPVKYIPTNLYQGASPISVDLDRPIDEVRAELSRYPVKTALSLSGKMIVARDIAHARIKKMCDEGQPIPSYMKEHPVFYAGPAKTPEGMPSGSIGPTTAGRMDTYTKLFQSMGASLIMVAKGKRSQEVVESCKQFGGFYLGAIGGPAALMASECVVSSRIIDFEDLGMEAVREIEVRNMPAFIVVNDKGEQLFC